MKRATVVQTSPPKWFYQGLAAFIVISAIPGRNNAAQLVPQSVAQKAIAATQPAKKAATQPTSQPAAKAKVATTGKRDYFSGGSESIVARTVGAAEGTRSADGGKTSLWEGHVDPGNGVWNRGTFSYQFGNEENLSAEESDKRQVAKIKRIYETVMLPKAQKLGITLTEMEEINGIDLINQAPLCITEDGGYIERLAEAKKKGLTGDEAILHGRVWSFWDPSQNGWDAPGLRAYDDMGKEASIRHDQKRRMGMINQAYQSVMAAIQKGGADYQPTSFTPAIATPPKQALIIRSDIEQSRGGRVPALNQQ